jgi:hypothetical protein
MSRYVRGDKLPHRLQREVLAKYVHRWTHENASQTYGGRCPGCVQARHEGRIVTGVENPGPAEKPVRVWAEAEWHAYHTPLVSDEQWLREHAFAVNKDGTLSEKQSYAEPAFMAEDQ